MCHMGASVQELELSNITFPGTLIENGHVNGHPNRDQNSRNQFNPLPDITDPHFYYAQIGESHFILTQGTFRRFTYEKTSVLSNDFRDE